MCEDLYNCCINFKNIESLSYYFNTIFSSSKQMKKYIKTFKIPPIPLQAKIRNGVRIDLNNKNINIEKSTYRNDEVKI